MSKNAIGDWSTTADNNADVGGINIAEGMSPANVNNALREIMSQLATMYSASNWLTEAGYAPSADLNNITLQGSYKFSPTDTNRPMSAYGSILHLTRGTDRYMQIAGTDSTSAIGRLFWREKSADGWSSWYEVQTFPTSATGVTKIDASGFYVGATGHLDPTVAEYGVTMTTAGALHLKRNGGQPMNIGRSNDGSIISFQSGQTTQGVISVSGTTVTYGTFCGAHWSQFHSFARPNVLPGTILETIDEMCIWPDEDGIAKPDDVLPRVRIAEPGSRSAYGVFSHWDMVDNEDGTQTQSRDFWVASLGAKFVRIAAGVEVQRGDLIEAGPDGCGVPQSDDVFRASTVAKITSTVRAETYPDGSFLLPCTLHCG